MQIKPDEKAHIKNTSPQYMCVIRVSITIHSTCTLGKTVLFNYTFFRYFSVSNKTRLFIIDINHPAHHKIWQFTRFWNREIIYISDCQLPSAKFSIYKRLILSWYIDEQTENDFIYGKKVRKDISWSKLRAIFRLDDRLGLKVFTKISSTSVAPDTHSVKV